LNRSIKLKVFPACKATTQSPELTPPCSVERETCKQVSKSTGIYSRTPSPLLSASTQSNPNATSIQIQIMAPKAPHPFPDRRNRLLFNRKWA